jgi:hypothetical protein
MGKRKEKDPTKPRVHPDLEGFNIEINSFGEVRTVYDLDKLNQFLNKNVRDKKFRGREDIEGAPTWEDAPKLDDAPTAEATMPDPEMQALLESDSDSEVMLDEDGLPIPADEDTVRLKPLLNIDVDTDIHSEQDSEIDPEFEDLRDLDSLPELKVNRPKIRD